MNFRIERDWNYLTRRFCFLLVALSCAAALAADEGPTSVDQDNILTLWSNQKINPDAIKLRTDSQTLFNKVHKAIEKWEDQVKDDDSQGKTLKIAAVGQAHVAVLQMMRAGQRLQAMGEPAGYDIFSRATVLSRKLDIIRGAVARTQAETLEKAFPAFSARCAKRLKSRDQAHKLVTDHKYLEGEKKLYAIYDDLEAIAFWYPDPEKRRGTMRPFDETMEICEGGRLQEIQDETQLTIADLRKKLAPDFAALPTELKAAAQSVASSGKVQVDGKDLTAAEALQGFIKRWKKVHVASVRISALDYASTDRDVWNRMGEFVRKYQDFTKEMFDGVNQLVSADLGLATPEEIQNSYPLYVTELAALVVAVDKAEWHPILRSSLEQFAAKSPAVLADVSAYRGATADLLRWRSRAAVASAKRLLATDRNDLTPTVAGPVSLAGITVPEAIATRIKKLGIAPLHEMGAVWGSDDASVAAARVNDSLYMRFDPTAWKLAVDSLATDCFANNGQPALSFEAAVSLAAARRGNLKQYQAKRELIQVWGFDVLFLTQTADAWALSPLGTLPQTFDPNQYPPVQQVYCGVNLKLNWVQGEHFFMEFR